MECNTRRAPNCEQEKDQRTLPDPCSSTTILRVRPICLSALSPRLTGLFMFVFCQGFFSLGEFILDLLAQEAVSNAGLTFSDMIRGDEGLHCDVACQVFHSPENKPNRETGRR